VARSGRSKPTSDAIGGGVYVGDALAQAEDLVTVSGLELSVLPSVQALLWEWASGIVPASDLEVEQIAAKRPVNLLTLPSAK
jgi:hypothetical protein